MHELMMVHRNNGRNSIKIYESPLHRGSQHGSPAFRRKKKLKHIKSDSQMSSAAAAGAEIAPPPRTKRASLPRCSKDTILEDDAKGSQNTPKKPPKPPNIITTSKIMSAPPTTNTSVGKISQDAEHIYESVDFPRQQQRLSAEVQCWPWPPKQGQTGKPVKLAKSIQNGFRSVSLGRATEPPKFHQNQPRGATILQRFSSFRRSLNSSRDRMQMTGAATNSTRRADDPDWVYFRGFGAKKREDVYEDGGRSHISKGTTVLTVQQPLDTPRPPPRRKRPQRLIKAEDKPALPLRRSLSFTDAQHIAQAVYEGDTKLIEELYPDFPRSEPIYAVVDKSRKRKSMGGCEGVGVDPPSLLPSQQLPVHAEASRECSCTSSASSTSARSNSRWTEAKQQPSQLNNINTNNNTTPSATDEVTFNNSVMFVRLQPEQPLGTTKAALPDLVNDSNGEIEANGVIIECPKASKASKASTLTLGRTWQSNVHPFAHRTQQRYALKNNNVSVTSTKDSVTLLNNDNLDDSFDQILRSADHSLHQAEFILSNLRQRSQTLPAHKTTASEDSDSLGSDIETNIRKLEKTQAKINAALEAFRHIKDEKSTASMSRPLVITTASRTAPAKMQQTSSSTASMRKILPRRHSFNNQSGDSSASVNTSASNKNYEADFEESEESKEAKDGSWSDSESGFLHPPIKSRLKGLLGTWGRKSRPHRPLVASVSEPVPILQPPVASVSEYARRIELLASDLSNGVATEAETTFRKSGSPASSGYYTPPMASASKKASPNSSQRNSSEENSDDDLMSDSEGQQSASASLSSASTNNNDAERNKTVAFYTANELMTSERVYVDVLKLLNVEFREFLQKARKEAKNGLMPDADYSRLFNNLPELQTLNEDLLQDFEGRIANWSSLPKIADVIVKKGPFLKLYTTYIREFSAVNYHFDECCQKYPKFAKLVKDFEKRDICRNLKLKHFMLKPVQRLPQYKLLLEDYLRHLSHDSSDFDDTTIALRIVSDAAEHANNTIRQGDKFRKMLQLQSRLGDYFELIRPGRDLIKEGELQKISRKGIGPRYFILLSDCLLYTSYSGSWSGSDTTSLRVSYQIPLSTLTVRLPPTTSLNNVDLEMATELHLTSPVRSFCVRTASVRERNAWLDALNTAIEDHNSRRATFLSNDHKIECKIGIAPPIWVPDRRVTMCQKCTIEFTVLVRRHHCRACGQVICATCSANKAPLKYLDFDSARVCDHCFEALEKELGNVESLRNRFKKREASRMPSGSHRYVPQRLKLSANGEGAQMSGYLRKKQKNGAKWKRLWFVLKDRVLYAYKAPEDSVACDTYPILGFILETLSEKNIELYEGESGGLVFQLAHPGSETLTFCADNDNICEKWIAAINEAVKIES